MTNDELATTIREFIKTNYQATYNGLLEVESLSEGGYKLILGIPSYMAQTQIACNVDDQDSFLEFIYSELLKRNYIRQYVYTIKRTTEDINE
jgi:hypothetical protein